MTEEARDIVTSQAGGMGLGLGPGMRIGCGSSSGGRLHLKLKLIRRMKNMNSRSQNTLPQTKTLQLGMIYLRLRGLDRKGIAKLGDNGILNVSLGDVCVETMKGSYLL